MIKHPYAVARSLAAVEVDEVADAYLDLFKLALEAGLVKEEDYCGVEGCGDPAELTLVRDGVNFRLCNVHFFLEKGREETAG